MCVVETRGVEISDSDLACLQIGDDASAHFYGHERIVEAGEAACGTGFGAVALFEIGLSEEASEAALARGGYQGAEGILSFVSGRWHAKRSEWTYGERQARGGGEGALVFGEETGRSDALGKFATFLGARVLDAALDSFRSLSRHASINWLF